MEEKVINEFFLASSSGCEFSILLGEDIQVNPANEDMLLSVMQKTPKKLPYSYVDGYKLNKNFITGCDSTVTKHMGAFLLFLLVQSLKSLILFIWIGGADYSRRNFIWHMDHMRSLRFSLKTYRWTHKRFSILQYIY